MKILFYTKEGCEACKIMSNILIDAINECRSNIIVANYCKGNKDNTHINFENIVFPTIKFVDDKNKELARLEGTYPKDYVINIISKIKD